MRRTLLALMIGFAAPAMTVMPAAAEGYAYCIRGCDYGGSFGDCSFSTYQQCQASASGRDAYCDANPFFSNAKAEMPANRSRLSRRRN